MWWVRWLQALTNENGSSIAASPCPSHPHRRSHRWLCGDEMLKGRNSTRGRLMAWSEKKAMQDYLQELMEGSNLKRREYGTVMVKPSRNILTKWTVAAYLAYPCVRTELQVLLAWCLMKVKRSDYEASNDSKSKQQELELMEALWELIARDNSAIARALCFVRLEWDRNPSPILEDCLVAIRQWGATRERIMLRALLELYQYMPLQIPTRESKDIESYRRLEEVRRYSNKELKVNREIIERARDPKKYAALPKLKSFRTCQACPE